MFILMDTFIIMTQHYFSIMLIFYHQDIDMVFWLVFVWSSNCHYYSTDINECNGNTTGCSQRCHNIIGGFQCFCFNGYSIHVDNKTCIGMFTAI